MSLQFSNLPLNEVVLRALFSERCPLKFGQYHEIWQRLADQFPAIEDLAIIETAGQQGVTFSPGQLLGLRLLQGDPASVMVDVQPNGVVVRWERDRRAPYPRFGALRAAFEAAFAAVQTVLSPSPPAVRVANVTYTNLIVPPPSEDPTADQTAHIVEYLVREIIPARAAGKPVHEVNLSWREGGDIDLRFALKQGRMMVPVVREDGEITPEERPVFNLLTSAGVFSSHPTDPVSDIDRLHAVLQPFFLSLLTERALEEWGYAADPDSK